MMQSRQGRSWNPHQNCYVSFNNCAECDEHGDAILFRTTSFADRNAINDRAKLVKWSIGQHY